MDEQALNEEFPGRTVRREGDQIVVSVPENFRQRNGRKMVNADSKNGSDKSKNEPNENETLVAAIAKAWAWQHELESGQYDSIEELAEANRKNCSDSFNCNSWNPRH